MRSNPCQHGQEYLFRGPYYNRRRSLPVRRTKPVIRKLIGVSTWVCHMRDLSIVQRPGFGLTPTEAYNDWKYHQQ